MTVRLEPSTTRLSARSRASKASDSTLSEGIIRLVRNLARTVEAAHGISANKEQSDER